MKALVWINDVDTEGNFSTSFLLRLSKIGASIKAYPKSGTEDEYIDMDTGYGFEFIRSYNGKDK
jgi:hypothetical protein